MKLQGWQKQIIDEATTESKKRTLIEKICEKQGIVASDKPNSSVKEMIEADVSAFEFTRLITWLAGQPVAQLETMAAMDPVG